MTNGLSVRRALGFAVRVVIVTVVLGLLAFAIGLLAGIVSLVLANAFGKQVSMAGAYRYFALPAGIFGLVVGFFGVLVAEIRERKRARPEYADPERHLPGGLMR